MSIFKKTLSIIMVCAMLFSIAPLTGYFESLKASATTDESEYFELEYETLYRLLEDRNGNKYYELFRIGKDLRGHLGIPSAINEYPVKSINENASVSCEGITSILLPMPFDGNLLGLNFANSKDFQKFIIDEQSSVAYTDEHGVLYSKDKTTIMFIPSGLALESYTIPASVKSINIACFARGTSIGSFKVEEGNENYSSDENGVLYNKDKTTLIRYPENAPADFVIPETVTELGDFAFAYSENIENIAIPSYVTTVSHGIFTSCTNLKKLQFPNTISFSESLNECNYAEKITVNKDDIIIEWGDDNTYATELYLDKTIDTLGFFYEVYTVIDGFGKITVEEGNENYKVVDGVLYDKDIKTLFFFPNGTDQKSFVMPDSVVEIDPITYHNHFKNLTSLTLGKNFRISETSLDEYVNKYGEWMGYYIYYSSAFALLQSPSLEEIKVSEENELFSAENGILYSKDKKALVIYPQSKECGDILFDSNTVICKFAYIGDFNKVTLSEKFCNSLYDGVCESIQKDGYDLSDESVRISVSDTLATILMSSTAKEFSITGNSDYFSVSDGVLYGFNETALIKYPIGNNKTFYQMPETVTYSAFGSQNDVFVSPFCSVFLDCAIIKKYSLKDSMAVHYSPDIEFINIMNNAGVSTSCMTELNDSALMINDSVESAVSQLGNDPHLHAKYAEKLYYSGMLDKYVHITMNVNEVLFDSIYSPITVCDGHTEPEWIVDNATGIECLPEEGCYDSPVSLSVSKGTEDSDIKTEFQIALSGKGDIEEIYNIRIVDSDGNVVQPQNGKKVTIKIKAPAVDDPEAKFFIYHRSSTKPGVFEPIIGDMLKHENGYLIFDVTHFSYFAVCVANNEPIVPDNPTEKTVSSVSIASLPSKTSYTYKTDNLDLSGLALTVTYSDGTTETVTDTSKMKITGFDNTKTGTQTVSAEYAGASASFDITVSYAWWQWIIRILLLGFLWY